MESDQRPGLANLVPLIAIVLTASGIFVKTAPLESKRPSNPDRIKFSRASHQDVEARLWQDPFTVMQQVKKLEQHERCREAMEDWAHHPSQLERIIARQRKRRQVTVLPVMIPGGPYFEDSETRRRARYAVVMALLHWRARPSDEDHIGYVWTFDSCVAQPWERQVPELLPYELFTLQEGQEESVFLVLWVDEDAISRQPIRGIDRLIELLIPDSEAEEKDLLCSLPSDLKESVSLYDDDKGTLAQKLVKDCQLKKIQRQGTIARSRNDKQDPQNARRNISLGDFLGELSWLFSFLLENFSASNQMKEGDLVKPDIHIIGPLTSGSLRRLVRELARDLIERDPDVQEVRWGLIERDPVVRKWKRDLLEPRDKPQRSEFQFYSSGATISEKALGFREILHNTLSTYLSKIEGKIESDRDAYDELFPYIFYGLEKKLEESFHHRVVRLTTTDDELVKALREELELRLADTTPWSLLSRFILPRRTSSYKAISGKDSPSSIPSPLTGEGEGGGERVAQGTERCSSPAPHPNLPPPGGKENTRDMHFEKSPNDTVVVISEGDTPYAQAFLKYFEENSPDEHQRLKCLRIQHVQYLQGLDGVLPTETSQPQPSASSLNDKARMNMDLVFDQAPLERAEGRSQYDYLRRLGAYLVDLDHREKREGRNGVRAVGVLGSDTYDKILILDALRDQLPEAIFFTTDLDARLLSREVLHSTRNLIVASSYGLMLNPGIQGATPSFRSTYQTGLYLSMLIALNSNPRNKLPDDLTHKPPDDLTQWFTTRLFEIGRTRAVPLSMGSNEDCKIKMLDPEHCKNIHAQDEWDGFSPWSNRTLVLALLFVAGTVVLLGLLLSRHARSVASAVWHTIVSERKVPTKRGVAVVLLLLLVFLGVKYCWNDVRSYEGEPFAWFEGVSIWPTKILELLILLVTVGLLFYGRWQLHRGIDTVAEQFSLTQLSEHESTRMSRAQSERGLWPWVRWLWWLGQSGSGTMASPWLAFLDRMRLSPTCKRVFVMTALYFAFGVALISFDWPFSPHRGPVSAWVNHSLLLALLLGMMALLLTVLDASEMTTRYLRRLDLHTLPQRQESTDKEFWTRYPVGEDAKRLQTRFRLAVELASRVNRLVYLPFIPLSLALITRSRVFDAWDIPLPYIALLGVSVVLAVRGAFSLRRAATELRTQTLVQLEHLELTAKLAPDARYDIPPQIKADLLRRIADEIRSAQEGPFRPWAQEPVVTALFIVSGWAGGLSTIEFLFLK